MTDYIFYLTLIRFRLLVGISSAKVSFHNKAAFYQRIPLVKASNQCSPCIRNNFSVTPLVIRINVSVVVNTHFLQTGGENLANVLLTCWLGLFMTSPDDVQDDDDDDGGETGKLIRLAHPSPRGFFSIWLSFNSTVLSQNITYQQWHFMLEDFGIPMRISFLLVRNKNLAMQAFALHCKSSKCSVCLK